MYATSNFAAVALILMLAVVLPRHASCDEGSECEKALAVLDKAGVRISYKNNRSYEERRKADDGSTCEGIVEIEYYAAEVSALKSLPVLKHLPHPDTISLGFSAFDATQAGDLAKYSSVLTKMKEVTIRVSTETPVSDTELRHFSTISNLVQLGMFTSKRMEVTDAGVASLKDLHQLRSLALNNTEVTDAGLVYFKGLTKLRFLSLVQTDVSGEGLRHLKDLPIERLMLVETKVDDDGLKHLQGFKSVEHLGLGGCPINGPGLKYLSELENLRRLGLPGTQIDDSSLVHLQDLPTLEDLSLYECRNITDGGVDSLKQLKGLKRLIINETKISKAGAETLRKALPDTKIEH